MFRLYLHDHIYTMIGSKNITQAYDFYIIHEMEM